MTCSHGNKREECTDERCGVTTRTAERAEKLRVAERAKLAAWPEVVERARFAKLKCDAGWYTTTLQALNDIIALAEAAERGESA